MVAGTNLFCKTFSGEMLQAYQGLPLVATVCVRHDGTTLPYSHLTIMRAHVSAAHIHTNVRPGYAFFDMDSTIMIQCLQRFWHVHPACSPPCCT
jgi:hypothetical protein